MKQNQHSMRPGDSLLLQLPREILLQTLEFCSGKSLSTLLLATCGSSDHCPEMWNQVKDIVYEGLEDMACRIQAHSASQPSLTAAIEWIRSIAGISQHDWKTEMGPRARLKTVKGRIGSLSENLSVLDYLHESFERFSDEAAGHFEWPIWCGRITIDSFSSGVKIRSSARIIITSPMQHPSFSPVSACFMRTYVHCSAFQCEPYNMIPVPPWGQIRGLQEQDSATLRSVRNHLDESNQVAIPTRCYCNFLDIRIVTKKLAQQSWQQIQRLETSWLVQKDVQNNPLLCCWFDDLPDLDDDRGYIVSIFDFLKARDRLSRLNEPYEEHC